MPESNKVEVGPEVARGIQAPINPRELFFPIMRGGLKAGSLTQNLKPEEESGEG